MPRQRCGFNTRAHTTVQHLAPDCYPTADPRTASSILAHTCLGHALILREADGTLPAGEYTFLPDDDNAIPDAIIPD